MIGLFLVNYAVDEGFDSVNDAVGKFASGPRVDVSDEEINLEAFISLPSNIK